jgi:hypothetical protein
MFERASGGAVHDCEYEVRHLADDLKILNRLLDDGVPARAVLLDKIVQQAHRYPPGTMLVVVDTTMPLEPQFSEAQRTINEILAERGRQPALRKNRIREWRAYLRVLDARAAGATDDEIATEVYPDSGNSYEDGFAGRKAVEAAYRRAMRLAKTFGVRAYAAPEEKFRV